MECFFLFFLLSVSTTWNFIVILHVDVMSTSFISFFSLLLLAVLIIPFFCALIFFTQTLSIISVLLVRKVSTMFFQLNKYFGLLVKV